MSQGSLRAWALALVIGAVGLVAATWIASSTWERVRTRPAERTIRVTGSAKKRIVSDLIAWTSRIETEDVDRTAAYAALRKHVEAARAYLVEQGVPAEQVRPSSVDTRELIETEYIGTGEDRIAREVSKGWATSQSITVRSPDVERVERLSREITQLLERGVPITSYPPRYHYTKLGEVKIDMLAEASADARQRAQQIVESAGGRGLADLARAQMGVINVNPANSTATSWEGNNDTTSLEKDIITVVTLTYSLQ